MTWYFMSGNPPCKTLHTQQNLNIFISDQEVGVCLLSSICWRTTGLSVAFYKYLPKSSEGKNSYLTH
jgi:hypothetical protein